MRTLNIAILCSLFIAPYSLWAAPKCMPAMSEPMISSRTDQWGNLILNHREVISPEGKVLYKSPTPCSHFTLSEGYRFVYDSCRDMIIDLEKKTQKRLHGATPKFINKNGDAVLEYSKILRNKEGAAPETIPPGHVSTRCGLIKIGKPSNPRALQIVDGDKAIDLPFEEEGGLDSAPSLVAYKIRCSPDRKKFVYISPVLQRTQIAPSTSTTVQTGTRLEVFDLASKKGFHLEVDGSVNPVYFLDNGEIVFNSASMQTGKSTMTTLSAAGNVTHKVELHEPGTYACGPGLVCNTHRDTVSKLSGKICDNDVIVRSDAEGCNCEKDFADALESISQKMNCELDGTDEAWQKLATPKSLSEQQLKVYLRKFQKRNGYQVPKDTAVLLAAAKLASENGSESVRSELANTLAFMNINGSSVPASLFSLYPDLQAKLTKAPVVDFCLSRSEFQSAQKSVERTVEYLRRGYTTSQAYLESISPFLKRLPESDKDAVIEAVADRSAQVFTANTGGSDSTGYYLAKNGLAPLFGRQGKELVDIQQVRAKGAARLQYVGNRPFTVDGVPAGQAAPGIFLTSKNAVLHGRNAGDKVVDETATIKMGDDVYKAKTELTVLPGKGENFVNSSDSIDYKALWKDKKLHGMVFLGSNYLGEAALNDQLVGYYLKYYKDQDFKLSGPKKINGTREAILGKISAGELDYMVKEAHSAADAHSLGKVSQTSVMYEGVKTHKDGRTETITILAPVADGQKATPIMRDEFAEAFQARKKKAGEKPFIYINNACSSYANTMAEVEKVADKNFVNIGNRSTVNTFWWHKSSTLYNLIDGVRNSRSFTDIAKDMSEAPKFKKGEDKYLLPNSPEYKAHITDQITVPVQLNVKIEKNGADYKLSNELGH